MLPQMRGLPTAQGIVFPSWGSLSREVRRFASYLLSLSMSVEAAGIVRSAFVSFESKVRVHNFTSKVETQRCRVAPGLLDWTRKIDNFGFTIRPFNNSVFTIRPFKVGNTS